MIIEYRTQHSWACLMAISASLLITRLLTNKHANGLNQVPGPALAAFTDFWRFFDVWRRRPDLTHIALHEKYGSIVRLGPSTVSISDPAVVQTIYGPNSGYTKSDFYKAQQTLNSSGKPLLTLFTSQDERFHSKLRRAVSNAYAMSTLVQFEPFVDSTTTEFFRQLDQRYANENAVLDFGTWLQYYAFDVIGELTYSKRLGFVDQGKDVDNVISSLDWLLNYAAPVGQLPILDRLLLKNPLRLQLAKWGFSTSASPVAVFARNRMQARVDPEKLEDMTFDDNQGRRDFLSRFLEAHQKDPEFISNDRVLALTVANMFAGSDTTAITLRAIFYYLMKHPDDMSTLIDELAGEEEAGRFTREDGLLLWNEVRDLPFLNAVIKEALRCHPAAGLMLERIVPDRGLQTNGYYIPAGSIVGVNAWVLHRNKEIFGQDADHWRPSRWTEASIEGQKLMEKSLFSFGAGSRTCIGKNISLLELYKLVPALLRRYKLEFPSSDNDWSLNNAWFVKQSNFNVRLQRKTKVSFIPEEGLAKASVTFTELDAAKIYYWRVDVVTVDKTHVGHTWTFQVAQLAFPGAEGWGRFARGGRGGKVVKVITLEDSEEPGTLRHALTIATGPRIVVFDVGGVITTKSRISVNDQYITLAGQTAPGKGIVIQGNPLGLTGASDIIFRHIRVRPGTVSGNTIDGMGMQGSNHAIFDRCSMGWTIDEAFSSRSSYNITFQRSIISEPLNVAGHKNYPKGTAHGYSATIGGDVGSFHHNLLAHAEGRSWSMGGGVDNRGNFAGRLDIRNNVVYNFGSRVTDGGAHQVNFVANYYKPGPASKLTYALRAQYEDGLPGTQTYHCSGNFMPGHFDQDSVQYSSNDGTSVSKDIACWADVSIDPAPAYQKFYNDEFFPSFVDTQKSTEAYKRVLSDSGASQPTLDDHDKRIIQETLAGSYNYTGSVSGKKGLIDNPENAGGLEDFPEVHRASTWDADDDGIADWWDGSTGGEGYTVIEGYLAFMAEPHSFVEPSGSLKIALGVLAAGFNKPRFTVTGAKLGSVKVDGSIALYSAGEAGVERLQITIADEDRSEWVRSYGIGVYAGVKQSM